MPPLLAPPQHVLSHVATANQLTEQPATILTAACDSLDLHRGNDASKAMRLLHVAMAFATAVEVCEDAAPPAAQRMERHAAHLATLSRQTLCAPLRYANEVPRPSPAWQGPGPVL